MPVISEGGLGARGAEAGTAPVVTCVEAIVEVAAGALAVPVEAPAVVVAPVAAVLPPMANLKAPPTALPGALVVVCVRLGCEAAANPAGEDCGAGLLATEKLNGDEVDPAADPDPAPGKMELFGST